MNQIQGELARQWDQARFQYPTLRRIVINGTPGLRGMQDVQIDFDYPLVAVAGKNGSGKSTILALAALAYHAPKGHFSLNAKYRRGAECAYYTFKDFFHRGPADPNPQGLYVGWHFSDGPGSSSMVDLRKRSEKWMHYDRRPKRPVHYLGVSRCVPAIEKSVLRYYFGATWGARESVPLDDVTLGYLGETLGRRYEGAVTLSSFGHSIRACETDHAYSSFNMGAGEDLLIEVLATLQGAPMGSLVVIEEIELGLHPEAVHRLGKVLLELCKARRLQLVVSTHSEAFLAALPPRARVLVQRAGEDRVVMQSPTVQLCMSDLTGSTQAEVFVYCEDVVAAMLIEEALPASTLSRVKVVPVGSNMDVAMAACVHVRQGMRQKALLVWDGDVSESDELGWLRARFGEEGAPGCVSTARLPGSRVPEDWLIDTLSDESGVLALASELRIATQIARDHIDCARAVRNPKDGIALVAERLGLGSDVLVRSMARSAARKSCSDLTDLTALIERTLG